MTATITHFTDARQRTYCHDCGRVEGYEPVYLGDPRHALCHDCGEPCDPVAAKSDRRAWRVAGALNGMEQRMDADVLASITRAALNLAADHPGAFGRNRSARILAGVVDAFPVGDVRQHLDVRRNVSANACGVGERSTLGIIDAAIEAGFLAKSHGPRPVLCITRKGFEMLAELERRQA